MPASKPDAELPYCDECGFEVEDESELCAECDRCDECCVCPGGFVEQDTEEDDEDELEEDDEE